MMLRASTAKRNYGHSGVVRDEKGKVIVQCVHGHHNRDDNRWLHPSKSYDDFPCDRSALKLRKAITTGS